MRLHCQVGERATDSLRVEHAGLSLHVTLYGIPLSLKYKSEIGAFSKEILERHNLLPFR